MAAGGTTVAGTACATAVGAPAIIAADRAGTIGSAAGADTAAAAGIASAAAVAAPVPGRIQPNIRPKMPGLSSAPEAPFAALAGWRGDGAAATGTGAAGTGATASTGVICGSGSAAGAAAAAAGTPESGLLRPNNRLKNPGADSPAGALVSGVVAGVGAVVGIAAGGAAAGAAVFTLLVPPTATGALADASDIAGAEPPPACGATAVDDPPRIRRKNPGGSSDAGAATSTALGTSTASHFSSFSDLSKNTVRRRFSGSFQPLAERKIKSQRS